MDSRKSDGWSVIVYMKILHYSLGFPPYRTGGMTKFCMDVMTEQVRKGNEVALLWPGQMKSFRKTLMIKRKNSVYGIASYEIINPLPVPYDEGIADINAFTLPVDPKSYFVFLEEFCPDVIHIHTFMGLHVEFLRAAHELGIRMVFTSHDFFALCPKVTLFRKNQICDEALNCTYCKECNATALSLRKLSLLQSPLYREIKDNRFMKILRKRHRDHFLNSDSEHKICSEGDYVSSVEEYMRLRLYYREMLSLVDVVHYNSSLTRNVYERFFVPAKSVLFPVTHENIEDHRREKKFSDYKRLSYLGPQGCGKGFYLLKDALDEVWQKNKNFELNIFFHVAAPAPYMRSHDGYSYDQLGKIMENTDVLVVSSVLIDTFGYPVPEALSYGVPVIVSGTVGAKDIIPKDCGIVVDDMNSRKLAEAIISLPADRLSQMNRAILEKYQVLTIEVMNDQLMRQCYNGDTGRQEQAEEK